MTVQTPGQPGIAGGSFFASMLEIAVDKPPAKCGCDPLQQIQPGVERFKKLRAAETETCR